jgi:hypothetical protein
MQDDGNLVFFGRYNAALWATDTGDARGASSLLILGGSTSDGSLYLEVYDYSTNTVSKTLYRQSSARSTAPRSAPTCA